MNGTAFNDNDDCRFKSINGEERTNLLGNFGETAYGVAQISKF